MKRLVRDFLGQSGVKKFTSLFRDTSIFEALSLLQLNKISALLIVENKKLLGIFSEKDFALASIRGHVSILDKIETVMTKNVYYVGPDFTLEECLQIMTKVHVRHLPVLDHGVPIALISMRDIMELLVKEKENHIRLLSAYITGGSPFEVIQTQPAFSEDPFYYVHETREAI